jgi:hypothetical protein
MLEACLETRHQEKPWLFPKALFLGVRQIV